MIDNEFILERIYRKAVSVFETDFGDIGVVSVYGIFTVAAHIIVIGI